MIPKEYKRLAELDFPIAEVSRHAVREKSIRHGHPSTLHLWWKRQPLASELHGDELLFVDAPEGSLCYRCPLSRTASRRGRCHESVRHPSWHLRNRQVSEGNQPLFGRR